MSSYIGRQLNNLSDRVKLDSITASATATYNLLLNGVAYVPSSAESLTVSLNGVIQAPQSSYTVSGSQITFASALTSSDSIDFILAERSITLQTPSAGSVGTSQLASSAVTTAKINADAVDGTKIADDSISDEHLDITAITGQTEKTSLADADKFLISDSAASGALKYVQKSNLPSGALTKVGSSTILRSSHGDSSVTNCFTTDYDAYLITWAITNDRDGNDVNFRFLKADGNTQNSDYSHHNFGYPSNSTSISQQHNSGHNTNILSGSCMGSSSSIMWSSWGNMFMFRPMGTTEFKSYVYTSTWYNTSGYPVAQSGGGRNGQTTAFTGIRFRPSANYFFSSDVHVYGLET